MIGSRDARQVSPGSFAGDSALVLGSSLLAVVVLYKLDPADSVSLQSLLRSRAAAIEEDASSIDLSILLVDNTPGRSERPSVQEDVLYLASPANQGLASAYNRSIEVAQKLGSTWLITLDQDTKLPEDFLLKLIAAGKQVEANPTIAAIVPQLNSGAVNLSPNCFRLGALATWFPKGYTGVPEQAVFAFNSAAMVRVDALEQIGGYDPLFWLDNSDARMFRSLHLMGKSVYVAGDIQVEHEFSMKAMQERVSPWRYRHSLLAESAFWDSDMSWLAGLERTLRLALRYVKHLRRGDSSELRSLTLRFLGLRLFRSRAHRRSLFRASVREHLGDALEQTALPARAPKISVCMAAYNGGRYVDLQLGSILPQLGPGDEVVIVDDCSKDDTRERIRAFGDGRIRLIEHAVNQGVVRTFEDALRSATGDILFLSDDDDLWAPDKVRRFMEAFARDEAVQLVVSAVALIDPEGKPFRDARWDRDGRFRRGFVRNVLKNQYQGSAMALRSSLLRSVLPFERGRSYLHDTWIGTVNDRTGGGLVWLAEPLLLYRRHPGNFSRRLSRWAQIRLRLELLWDHARRAL
jgi:GT2 family glycosyltransferase